jgi:hypothetical protein
MLRAVVVLIFLLLIPTPADAEIFATTDGVVLFSLARSRTTTPIDADLKVSARFVWSQSGVRRVKRKGKLERREVTVLNEPYDVKDSRGGKWRMWIREVAGKSITVELVRTPPRVFPIQVLEVSTVTVMGESTDPALPSLTLFPDGHYRLGHHIGRYWRDETGVLLGGPAAHWGRGAYAIKGDGLVFRFKRGPLAYEVRYQNVEDPEEDEEPEEIFAGVGR